MVHSQPLSMALETLFVKHPNDGRMTKVTFSQVNPEPAAELTRRQRVLTMFSLILAGEAIFMPAFHMGRYFKSSLLTTFAIDEFQLGQMGAAYGVLATDRLADSRSA